MNFKESKAIYLHHLDECKGFYYMGRIESN